MLHSDYKRRLAIRENFYESKTYFSGNSVFISYRLEFSEGQEITQALGEISVQVKEIKEEQLGETLGYCLGLPGFLKTILRWRKKALTRRSLS